MEGFARLAEVIPGPAADGPKVLLHHNNIELSRQSGWVRCSIAYTSGYQIESPSATLVAGVNTPSRRNA